MRALHAITYRIHTFCLIVCSSALWPAEIQPVAHGYCGLPGPEIAISGAPQFSPTVPRPPSLGRGCQGEDNGLYKGGSMLCLEAVSFRDTVSVLYATGTDSFSGDIEDLSGVLFQTDW
jgi:hypothetical protein